MLTHSRICCTNPLHQIVSPAKASRTILRASRQAHGARLQIGSRFAPTCQSAAFESHGRKTSKTGRQEQVPSALKLCERKTMPAWTETLRHFSSWTFMSPGNEAHRAMETARGPIIRLPEQPERLNESWKQKAHLSRIASRCMRRCEGCSRRSRCHRCHNLVSLRSSVSSRRRLPLKGSSERIADSLSMKHRRRTLQRL